MSNALIDWFRDRRRLSRTMANSDYWKARTAVEREWIRECDHSLQDWMVATGKVPTSPVRRFNIGTVPPRSTVTVSFGPGDDDQAHKV